MRAKGLGGDFINELESAYEAIAELPAVWPQFGKGFQRYILTRFPFAVIYRQSNEKIYVIAVMHQSRKPGYWLNRIVEYKNQASNPGDTKSFLSIRQRRFLNRQLPIYSINAN